MVTEREEGGRGRKHDGIVTEEKTAVRRRTHNHFPCLIIVNSCNLDPNLSLGNLLAAAAAAGSLATACFTFHSSTHGRKSRAAMAAIACCCCCCCTQQAACSLETENTLGHRVIDRGWYNRFDIVGRRVLIQNGARAERSQSGANSRQARKIRWTWKREKLVDVVYFIEVSMDACKRNDQKKLSFS